MERFNLWVVLGFVLVEEMDSAAAWAPPGLGEYVRECGLMVAAELVGAVAGRDSTSIE